MRLCEKFPKMKALTETVVTNCKQARRYRVRSTNESNEK